MASFSVNSKGLKMKSFYDLPEIVRFQVYGALTALDCETGQSGGSGQLCVAVARGKFGELCKTLDKLGFDNVNSYYFPLGTDKPSMQLRHDSIRYGGQNCNWFYATFKVKSEAQ
jgi:hypothetical protein